MVRSRPHVVALAALAATFLSPVVLGHDGLEQRFARASAAIASAPDDAARAHAFLLRADLFRLGGDARSAFADLRAAERAGARAESVAIGRASVRATSGQYEDLVDAPVPAGLQSPDLPRLRGLALRALGREREAATEYERAVALATTRLPEDYIEWFDALVATGDPALAARADDVIACGIADLGPLPLFLRRAGLTAPAAPTRFHRPGVASRGPAETDGVPVVMRGPYLQLGTSDSMVVRWRTDAATDSRVLYGTDLAALDQSVEDSALLTDHVVVLTGLTSGTDYYYAVGTTTDMLAGGDANHRFHTSPPIGTAGPMRIWVIGDSGTGSADQENVYQAYLDYTGAQRTDVWLLLGDNAYPDGTDANYQAAFFDMYPQFLRQNAFWSAFGNHDASSADSATQTGPYYELATYPTNGEAGGVPSGTEAYYSFDFRNVHFVSLDSSESPTLPTGPMVEWLELDLSSTTADWVIAFWHHPPYSKGTHDSDVEQQMTRMREHVVPVLEAYGVDLSLTGHSHSYERSYLLDGHYGPSDTFAPKYLVDGGDGRVESDGAYDKGAGGAHSGAVYVVAGSSGKTSAGPLDHPAMYWGIVELGSLVIEVDGGRMDVEFLRETGQVQDWFTMLKGGCTEDLDGDGIVGVYELLAVLGDWDAAGSEADLDGDGVVGVGDLLIVLGAWGSC